MQFLSQMFETNLKFSHVFFYSYEGLMYFYLCVTLENSRNILVGQADVKREKFWEIYNFFCSQSFEQSLILENSVIKNQIRDFSVFNICKIEKNE